MNSCNSTGQPASALTNAFLEEAFEKWWPDLEAEIRTIPESAENTPRRADSDKIDEILDIVRRIARRPIRTVLKVNRLPAFRAFVSSRRAALAGFMQQGASLRLRGDSLTVIPRNDIYVRYLSDNSSVLAELASEFFGRPMTVTVVAEESEVPESDE
jgi:hypothetical protein